MLLATSTRSPRSAIDRIDHLCAEGLEPRALLEAVSDEITAVVRAEAVFIAATDPDTMLGLGAGLVRNMPDDLCEPYWSYEFEVPDFSKYVDLAREERPVADLHTVTGGRPERSARWREFSRHPHLRAELRSVLKAGGRGWGIMQLNREETDAGGFDAAEVEFVEEVGPIVARALRHAALRRASASCDIANPGMAVLDEGHHLLSATPDALRWFGAMQSYHQRRTTELGVRLPWEVVHAAQLAQSTPHGDAAPVSRARIRTKCGKWVLIHASVMTAPDGHTRQTAIVVEPASASEVASLLVQAYELTPRELDVTRALARGLTITEVAEHLFLSRYTVQDHLKRIYEKVGVASRAELVAKVFADHYHDRMDLARVPA